MQRELNTSYKGRILEAKNLPAMPAALAELTRLMQDPDVSTEKMARVIDKDQALAVKVLKLVNSPIYGFPGRISTVHHALVLLGINVVRGLIISSAVFDVANKAMLGLWEHSLACSLAAGEIASICRYECPEEATVMGLLHDIGKVVVALQIPEAKKEIDDLVKNEDIMYYEAETRVLGFSHTRVNAWLCDQWHLPLSLKEAMVHHHDPTAAISFPEASSIVHLADFFARLFACGSGGDDNVPPVDPKALRLLNIEHKKLEKILSELTDVYSENGNLGCYNGN